MKTQHLPCLTAVSGLMTCLTLQWKLLSWVVAASYRGADKGGDSRWTSGTYLLVHPASKHLGNARIRVKVLIELKPQSSGRVSSRQWQVPQVALSAAQAAIPNSPDTKGPPALASALPNLSADHTDVTIFPLASNVLNNQLPAAAARGKGTDKVNTLDSATAAAGLRTAEEAGQAAIAPGHAVAVSQSRVTQNPLIASPVSGTRAAVTDQLTNLTDLGWLPQLAHSSAHSSQADTQEMTDTSTQIEKQQQGDSSPPKLSGPQAQPTRHEGTLVQPAQQRQDSEGRSLGAVLCIEEALHLALPSLSGHLLPQKPPATSRSSSGPVQVQVGYRQTGQWESTPAVEASQSGGAVWHHTAAMPEALQDQNDKMVELQVCMWPYSQVISQRRRIAILQTRRHALERYKHFCWQLSSHWQKLCTGGMLCDCLL